MKALSRNNRLLLLIIGLLLLLVLTSALLNTGDLALKRQLEMDQQFILSWNGAEGPQQARVSMEDILALRPQEREAVLDTSISDAETVLVLGVELSALLDYYDIPWTADNYFEINGLDEYYSPVLYDEVLAPDNVLICIAMNGQSLGSKSTGGFGPYMMVIRNERFSQRWCKYVEEVAVR